MLKEREINLYHNPQTGQWVAEGEGIAAQADTLEQLLDDLKTLIPQEGELEVVSGPIARGKLHIIPATKKPLGLPKGERVVPQGGLVSEAVATQREERQQHIMGKKQ